ncbi:unnamed protein product, partial [marine sediment metagenome]
KNGPTIAEYRDVAKRTIYRLGGVGWPLRNVRKCARAPAKRPVMNIAAA